MKSRVQKTKFTRILNYRYFIYIGIIIALLQFWALRSFYEEQQIIKLPDDLFRGVVDYPLSELTLDYIPDSTSGGALSGDINSEDSTSDSSKILSEGDSEEKEDLETEDLGLSDIQKQIILGLYRCDICCPQRCGF
jgi:hypothetical protein